MAAAASQIFAAKKRALFLDALSTCGNVTAAAKAAGVTPRRLYQVRATDAAFAAAWDESAELGAQALEDEARRRAFNGVDEPLTCAKGLILDDMGNPVMLRKYSDTLLIFLLKGARPQKYRENVKVSGSINTNIVPSEKADILLDRLIKRFADQPEVRATIADELLAGGTVDA